MARAADDFGPAKQHSGWLIPLVVFFVTACLSALVFAFYFAPGRAALGQEPAYPTDAIRRIAVDVGATHLRIPANYIPLASARNGGPMQEVPLAAVLPNLDGYSLGIADEFDGNAPESRIVFLSLKSNRPLLPEKERLDRIYLNQVEDRYGEAGPDELRHYTFRADSGYHNDELFFGQAESGPMTLICNKPSPSVPSPNCLRDLLLKNGLSLSYRFKRVHLSQWREIDKRVRALIESFVQDS